MKTIKQIGGWKVVKRQRLKQLQQNNEWIKAGKQWFGFQMYWNNAQGGLWIKIKGKESDEWDRAYNW